MNSGEGTNLYKRTQEPESREGTGAQEVLSTSGIGFRFVRFFLLAILCVVGCMIGLTVLLGWHLGMDVTVKGQGHVQPTSREIVKARRPGLIKTVLVNHGQDVNEGDLLLTLDDTDLRNEVEQIENELRLNEIRRAALPAEWERERAIIEMDIARAETDRDTEILHLERARVEYEFNHSVLPFHKHEDFEHPIDKLIPMREHKVKLRRAKVEIEHAKRRLAALDSRKQELNELKQMYRNLRVRYRLLKTHLEQMNIHASVSGTVLTRDLDKRVGDHVTAGEAVLEMAEMSGWQAKVMLQEVDIPKVKVGQMVRLYINAFPHMEFKIFEGIVSDVPGKPESVTPVGAGIAPSGIAAAVYPVKVQVNDPNITIGEKVYSLKYGLGVEAKIVTERGPIVELLWIKFLKTVGKVGRPEVYLLKEPAEGVPAAN
ncbi:MAG: HlyD family efflux transporter periplasmic adaptor subunit [Gemmatimonadota bacterium]|nr:HlyD family efflux transporter periplasmic adaptor subunit [Gemmatimonadota bacterium]